MAEVTEANLVAVGLDVGSINARIYISNAKQEPSIVANEIGERHTLALSTPEPNAESDPMNDQYWDDNKKKKDKAKGPAKEVHYLYGDAARKSLERLKKPLAPHTILNMAQQVDNAEDDVDADVEPEFDPKAASAAFFQHLTNLTTNASHTNPQNLRFVLSTPPSSDDSNKASLANLSSALKMGLLQSIDQAGYKKTEKKAIYGEKRIVAIVTHPVAIAHAHKLFSKPTTQNVLIVDWGASSLSMSHLSISSGGMAQIQKHVSDESFSGKNIIAVLVKHIAELFERANRGVMRGETLRNKKAKAKLEVAAEDALRSLGFSPKVTVTVDGLIDGIDCHVDVMLARFEMLMAALLKSAESKLKEFGDFDSDSVIGAGSVIKMKCIDKMMDRLYPRDQVSRGESVTDVPPDEAVALGCAIYGSMYLSTSYVMADDESKEAEAEDACVLVDEEVPLCPVGIGLSLVAGDPAALVLIERGTPLPALVTKVVDVTGCSNSMDIVQINDGEKVLGRIEGIDASGGSKEVEVTMELTVEGKLSVSVNGGPVFEI
jgi:molecular chaperone DnaK (HSP70)